jgi:SAM-dependent methyltransferase
MGSPNQTLFVERHAERFHGPFLEVGSKNYGSTQDLRRLFSGRGAYVGVDLEAGAGVDAVLDLTQDFAVIDAALGGERFGTIFCLSVLEHCEQPFRMAANLTGLLRPDGHLCVSVPFSWKFHGYPSDYWRFTHEGVRKLFPRCEFDPRDGTSASSRAGEFSPLDTELGKIAFSGQPHRRRGHALRGLTASVLKTIAAAGPLRWFAGYRYVLAPTEVMMIGRPRANGEQARAA